MANWLARRTTDYIYRGCVDPSDPELRRHTALHNITALSGRLVAGSLGVVNLVEGRRSVGLALIAAALLMWLATLVHHRRKDPLLAAWMGVSAAGAVFLYMLASRGQGATGFIWLPVFPLFPMFTLGRARGKWLTLLYLSLAAIIMFVPGLPGIAPYPASLGVRLLVASSFAAALAFYYEYSRETAHARLLSEIEVRRRAEADLTRASAVKSDLLAAVSHEVRTPLTAIMGLHDLLSQTDLDDKQRSYIELAARSGRSLIAVMNDLLDLSKVEAGKLQLEAVPFDFHELTRALVDMHSVLTGDRRLALELEWDEGMPRIIVGDPSRMRQVLGNLLSNAVKFTPHGRVIVNVRRTASDVLVTVDDTGIGLSEEQQDAVFDAFIQTDAAAVGSGLGLAIAKNLVESMGGEIGVRSRLGEGSSFWFRLPFVRAENGVVEPTAATGETRIAGRVLLVEDNDLNREVLRLMLERLGCTVETATNGEEGVAAFAAASYDLVLMDCQMPVLDGYGATSRIRAGEGDSRTPIVAITAYALPEDLERCIEAGMDDHITKPLMLEDVVATLGRWLGQSKAGTHVEERPEIELA